MRLRHRSMFLTHRRRKYLSRQQELTHNLFENMRSCKNGCRISDVAAILMSVMDRLYFPAFVSVAPVIFFR